LICTHDGEKWVQEYLTDEELKEKLKTPHPDYVELCKALQPYAWRLPVRTWEERREDILAQDDLFPGISEKHTWCNRTRGE